jgi:hypothetical protein
LSKTTANIFKNAVKFVLKDKDTIHPNLKGVYFTYDETINKKYLVSSNGKVAIIYMDIDFPNDFIGKVIDAKGNIISTQYPNVKFPAEVNETISVNMEHLKSLYDTATIEVKENKITQAKAIKQKQIVGVPIADGLEIDYFYYQDFMKMIELVGTNIILYNKEMGSIAVSTRADKSVIGLVLNNYTSI